MNPSDIPEQIENISEESICVFNCADIDTHYTLCGRPGEFLMD